MKIPENESITIVIKARKTWNETDIEVAPGEEYDFEASGQWKDLLEKTDADGYTNAYMELWNALKRSKGNLWFALIGSVDKNGDFLIGKQKTVAIQEKGLLYFFANDARFFYWNNSGKLQLTITRKK